MSLRSWQRRMTSMLVLFHALSYGILWYMLRNLQFGDTINHGHFVKSLFEYVDELPYDLVPGHLNDCQSASARYEACGSAKLGKMEHAAPVVPAFGQGNGRGVPAVAVPASAVISLAAPTNENNDTIS